MYNPLNLDLDLLRNLQVAVSRTKDRGFIGGRVRGVHFVMIGRINGSKTMPFLLMVFRPLPNLAYDRFPSSKLIGSSSTSVIM